MLLFGLFPEFPALDEDPTAGWSLGREDGGRREVGGEFAPVAPRRWRRASSEGSTGTELGVKGDELLRELSQEATGTPVLCPPVAEALPSIAYVARLLGTSKRYVEEPTLLL